MIDSRSTDPQAAASGPAEPSDSSVPSSAPGLRSAIVHRGTLRASARSFLHALGQDDEEIARPHVGVFHTGGEMSPCNMNLRDQASMPRPASMRAAACRTSALWSRSATA